MSLIRYFVARQGEQWAVLLDGRSMGKHPSRQEAVRSAIIMADLMGAMHHDADVMAENDLGEGLALLWTYGVDPLPKERAPAAEVEREGHVRRVYAQSADGS